MPMTPKTLFFSWYDHYVNFATNTALSVIVIGTSYRGIFDNLIFNNPRNIL